MKQVKDMYYQFDEETKTTLDSLSKGMKKEVAAIESLFMQEEGLKGIQRENKNISGYSWMTISYMEDSDWSIGASQMTELMYAKLKDSVDEAVEQINAFYDDSFKTYMEQVKSAPKSIFEDRETLK